MRRRIPEPEHKLLHRLLRSVVEVNDEAACELRQFLADLDVCRAALEKADLRSRRFGAALTGARSALGWLGDKAPDPPKGRFWAEEVAAFLEIRPDSLRREVFGRIPQPIRGLVFQEEGFICPCCGTKQAPRTS